MKKGLDSLFGPTAIIFGVISLAIYFFIIRPLLPSTRGPADANRGTQTNATAAVNDIAATTTRQEQIQCSRVPPHVSETSAKLAVNGGANLLMDGLVAFKHCRAAVVVTASDDENRKARAKLLANLLEHSGVAAPPAKGSAVVVTIPVDSVDCPQQRRVLYLLATYYNLLVILAVPDAEFTEQDRLKAIHALRGIDTDSILAAEILPTHRIVVASTVTGRVAFVRQLQRIELMLDFDPEVLGLLARFGHRVIVYGGGSSGGNGATAVDTSISALGRAML
jgi:hypothetical protein